MKAHANDRAAGQFVTTHRHPPVRHAPFLPEPYLMAPTVVRGSPATRYDRADRSHRHDAPSGLSLTRLVVLRLFGKVLDERFDVESATEELHHSLAERGNLVFQH
jgi:hypothetical protein